jgi:tetratricopeptide (TPR) repeat protein
MDILSLVSLTGWVSKSLDEDGGQHFEHAEDQLSVLRMHFVQKHYDEVIPHATRFLEAHAASALRRECLEMLGLAYKRRQRFTEMQEAFELLLDEFPSDIQARIELAKHHEHRTRNLLEAERLCREAADRGGQEVGAHELAHRLERIQRKLAKGLGRMDEMD